LARLFEKGCPFVGQIDFLQLRLHGSGVHFHRLGRTFQVAEHVLQNLDEFNVNTNHAFGDLASQIADHLVDVTLALGSRLEFNENIALVLGRREQAQLGTGAARIGILFRQSFHLGFHLPHQRVRLA